MPPILLALSRDEAKRLFAQRDAAALKEAIAEWAADDDRSTAGRNYPCGPEWQLLARFFTDGTLEPGVGEFPLNQAFLGGRRLNQGDDVNVYLVRPDVTPLVADALAEWTHSRLREQFATLEPTTEVLVQPDPEAVWQLLEEVRQFYQQAASRKDAVLFAAPRECDSHP